MYFKELKLYGFKSFKDETKLRFEPGVTAIVGPNGTGKSNLTDAVKWVLGEQSAKELRGSSMEDVIFNGTAQAEPIGMAEVSLTLLNESNVLPIDYDEVTLTRRVYRSGESDYFINDTKVRLKDIQQLIMGTGIGTSAYSIIEQGKIDLILSSKPQDRRYIFEEASGITKYKAKKRETLNKLERTQQNLQRINDIIGEVERQLRSIQRKVKKAQRYKRKFQQLERLEMIFSKREYKKIESEMHKVESDSQKYNERLEGLRSDISDIKSELNEVNSKSHKLTQNLEVMQNTLIEINNLINGLESKLNLSKERINDLEQRIKNLKISQNEIDYKINDVKSQLSESNITLEKLSEEKNTINESIVQGDKRLESIQHEISQEERKIEETKRELVNNISEETNFKNEIVRIDSDMRNYNNRLIRLNHERQDLEDEKKEVQQKIQDTKTEVEELEQNLKEKETKRKGIEEKLGYLKKEYNDLKNEIDRNQNDYNEIKSKYNLCKQLKHEYGGFSPSIKKLMKLKEEKGLKFEVLADLVEVKRGYRRALEVALDQDVQSIVVSEKNEAMKIMQLLDEIKAGKCKIIILNQYCDNPGKSVNGTIDYKINSDQILGEAISYIKPKHKRYRPLFKKILSNKYIVKNRKMGLECCKREENRNMSFITLNGELYQRGSFLAGKVSNKEGFSLIGREFIISQLAEKLSDLEGLIRNKKISLQDKREQISNKEEDADNIIENIQLLQGKRRDKENILLNFKTEFKKIQDEYTVIDTELKEVSQELSDLRERKSQIEYEKRQVSNEIETKQKLISDCQKIKENLNNEREELIVQKGKLKSKISQIAERKQSYDEKIEMLTGLLHEQQQKLNSTKLEREETKKRILKLESEINNYKEEKVKLNIQKEEMVSNLDNLKNERKACFKKKEELERQLSKKQEIVQSQMQELQQINMKESELKFKLEQIENRIRDKYNKDLKNFSLSQSDLEQDMSKLKQDIDTVARRLDSIGPVSLAAIEEHEELKERHSFLVDQRQDLLHAEESLRKAIRRINKTTRSLFMETFRKIQVEFDNFFKSLFGGGRTLIKLEDEKNILESGIEIIAQPKGKKLQNISLLSGGERTLTAIALLFAIFKVKPSPFCLLDEIDATLDEANIDRFSRVLQEFVKTSQFIIITHNKKTITLADVIYGVTMEKSGISKLVSVKLVDKEVQKSFS